jgi:hypothetical protein
MIFRFFFQCIFAPYVNFFQIWVLPEAGDCEHVRETALNFERVYFKFDEKGKPAVFTIPGALGLGFPFWKQK